MPCHERKADDTSMLDARSPIPLVSTESLLTIHEFLRLLNNLCWWEARPPASAVRCNSLTIPCNRICFENSLTQRNEINCFLNVELGIKPSVVSTVWALSVVCLTYAQICLQLAVMTADNHATG